jgi:hypothetical protein
VMGEGEVRRDGRHRLGNCKFSVNLIDCYGDNETNKSYRRAGAGEPACLNDKITAYNWLV